MLKKLIPALLLVLALAAPASAQIATTCNDWRPGEGENTRTCVTTFTARDPGVHTTTISLSEEAVTLAGIKVTSTDGTDIDVMVRDNTTAGATRSFYFNDCAGGLADGCTSGTIDGVAYTLIIDRAPLDVVADPTSMGVTLWSDNNDGGARTWIVVTRWRKR